MSTGLQGLSLTVISALIVPVGAAYRSVDADQVFATLSTFGLRLEDG